ncbi:MAG: histidine phosphatase family protein [Motiliproteus sp.]
MSLRIFALRHGSTAWNQQKRLQGRRDIPLSEKGIQALENLTIPSRFSQLQWYCSPLQRTRQSAELLNISRYQLETALLEMDWGAWEGECLPDLRIRLGRSMQQQESRGLDLQPPGGESPRQVRERLLIWLAQLPSQPDIGIICHKGVLRSLLSEALDWDMKTDCPVKVDWHRGLLFQWHGDSGLILEEHNISLQEVPC